MKKVRDVYFSKTTLFEGADIIKATLLFQSVNNLKLLQEIATSEVFNFHCFLQENPVVTVLCSGLLYILVNCSHFFY